MSTFVAKAAADLTKIEPLNGLNYRRWAVKLMIHFEALEIDYVVLNGPPANLLEAVLPAQPVTTDDEQSDNAATEQNAAAADPKTPLSSKTDDRIQDTRTKYERDNKTVRGILLHYMSDALLDIYASHKCAKTIWDLLRKKYGSDDAGRKKYAVARWLNYKMMDGKPVIDQVHEYENLVGDLITEGIPVSDALQTYSLLEKLPESWSGFQNKMKHEPKECTWEEMVNHINIEEAFCLRQSSISFSEKMKANVIETSDRSKNGNAGQNKTWKKNVKVNNTNNFKANKNHKAGKGGPCYVCGKHGHRAAQCYYKKGGNDPKGNQGGPKNQANVVEESEVVAAVITLEANIVEDSKEWVVDTGASRHFCSNKGLFKNFQAIAQGQGDQVYMGNDSMAEVRGSGSVEIKLCSGKNLLLSNVMYVPTLRRNLVSGPLLVRAGIKLVFESEKMIMSRRGEYLGKGYLRGGLFVLPLIAFTNENITNNANKVNNVASGSGNSAYIAISFDMWHASSQRDEPTLFPPSQSEYDPDQLKRSKRQRTETSFGSDFITYITELKDINELSEQFVCQLILEEEPKTFEAAMRSVDAVFWKEAVQSELDSIKSNHTWELVELPKGAKPIGCKWIFKRKLRPDGSIERFKARLVAKGYKQKFGEDYFCTYSPVTKIATIRVLFALAVAHKWTVHQMDVKTAFLNGDLEEEIYMEQPSGCVDPGQEGKVCRLVKSLYGLKQAPKQWNEKFHRTLMELGYTVNRSDACLYSKQFESSMVLICIYVDDMLIFSPNVSAIIETKRSLCEKFDMKNLGEADVILGVKVIQSGSNYKLSQSHYTEKLLRKFNSFEVTPAPTPYDSSVKLTKHTGTGVAQEDYAKIIGSLMFLMNYTRPDIALAVNRLSRYTHNPSEAHWHALKRVLRYLRGTVEWGLNYTGFPNVLEGYCDANWVNDSDDVSSTSGYVFTMGEAAVSWKSTKQSCIARSTMEAEFIALDLAGQESEWLRNLLADMPLWGNSTPSIHIHCDSQTAICVAKNSMYNVKRRHIRVRHESVRQLIVNGVITLEYVKSEKNIADPLTKGLNRKGILDTSREMGLK
ncbi:PREDICTED: uncharacterized protein LOC109168888 [Ipomoea nil]|uniref:uncharacterized protein LOC109168888 n=1 Tax=Ipomoea nil TaxID=35883 RepID=UPI0009008546|nr:PREDICTED: uncharacterized protein LOC109168888 [Ipomoea nil]